jgi:hypothetical protein
MNLNVSIREGNFFSLGSGGSPQVYDKSSQRHVAGAPDETNAQSDNESKKLMVRTKLQGALMTEAKR